MTISGISLTDRLPKDCITYSLSFLGFKELVRVYEGCVSKTMCVYAKEASKQLLSRLHHLGNDIAFCVNGLLYNDIGYHALFHGHMEDEDNEWVRKNYTDLLNSMTKLRSLRLVIHRMIDSVLPPALDEIFASKSMAQLTELNLSASLVENQLAITNPLVAKIAILCPRLKILRLENCALTDESSRSLATLKLQKLSFVWCRWISTETGEPLPQGQFANAHVALCAYSPTKILDSAKILDGAPTADNFIPDYKFDDTDAHINHIRTQIHLGSTELTYFHPNYSSARLIAIARKCKDFKGTIFSFSSIPSSESRGTIVKDSR